MFFRCILLVFFILSLAQSSATAADFERMVVYGDSLSDTGRVHEMSGGTFPKSPPYYNGRFSNGPVWVERLAEELELEGSQVSNYAVGGAKCGYGNANPGYQRTGVLGQVEDSLAEERYKPSGTLFVIEAGANDYLHGGNISPSSPTASLALAVRQLSEAGGRHFLVANLPDFSSSPFVRHMLSAEDQAKLAQRTREHNALLAERLSKLEEEREIQITTLDFHGLFQNMKSEPKAFGFTNVEDPRLSAKGKGGPEESWLWWDIVHPSAKGHEWMAKEGMKALEEQEPAEARPAVD